MTGTQYVHDGTGWVDVAAGGTPPPPDVQDFTASGTWNMPADARLVFIELISGGGGGAASGGNDAGGGGYFSWMTPAANLDATESVTVGAGGAVAAQGGASQFAGVILPGGGKGVPISKTSRAIPGGMTYKNSNFTDSDGYAVGPSLGGSYANNTGNPDFGAGGGSSSNGNVGGTKASQFGLLQAGDIGNAPGGAGPLNTAGARGQVRITTYF